MTSLNNDTHRGCDAESFQNPKSSRTNRPPFATMFGTIAPPKQRCGIAQGLFGRIQRNSDFVAGIRDMYI